MTSLSGQVVAFTGRLASMPRRDADALVTGRGGQVTTAVEESTTLLILGQLGWPLRSNGRITGNLRRARLLQRQGVPIQIQSEDAFLETLDGPRDGICRECTLPQLVRLLGVRRERVLSWVRSGLLRPTRTVHRLQYFDYPQVGAAKSLVELLGKGVRRERIARSLKQLRRWLPQADASLAQLSLLSSANVLATRTRDGRLLEPGGQTLFDFDRLDWDPLSLERSVSPDELFERASLMEEAGQFREAAECYGEWLERFGPDAQAWFNRGNSLASLGDLQEAEACYRKAIAADPEFVEAWNNLGNLLAERRTPVEAVQAFRRALALDPGYFDAHYNLAQTLDLLGRTAEARLHWTAYLKFDRQSPWARHARERLDG